MGHVFFRTTVADYDRWKPVFDEDAGDRRAAGSNGGELFRDAEDPNVVYILFEWDLEQARQYGQSGISRGRCRRPGSLDHRTSSS
ncbi:MAG: hypothetical protein JOZ15_13980 [Acidobacteria bacterium]|nr:hypothetical protein [Acidobacteriota bacterium]